VVVGVDALAGVGVGMGADVGAGVGAGIEICADVGLHPVKDNVKTKRRGTRKTKGLHFLVADLFMPAILQPPFHLRILI